MQMYVNMEAIKVRVFFSAVDFSIMVLSSGAWPFSQGPPFALPQEVRGHVIQLKYSSASASGTYRISVCDVVQYMNNQQTTTPL